MSAAICRTCGVVHTDEGAPIADCPDTLFAELIDELRFAMDNAPRNLQQHIGPSEIGNPCSRALIHKLTGSAKPARPSSKPDGWRARVGSAMHAQCEEVFSADHLRGRFIVEGKVSVGEINGQEITGHSDLFDTLGCANWDWKTKSKTQFDKARRDINAGRGPGQLYRTQAHLYGRGRERAGYPVRWVGIVYLLRDGNLRDSFPWVERYDEQIAVAALDRCTGLAQLAAALGKPAALAMFPLCDGEYCDYCAADRPVKPAPASTRELIAGMRR